MTFFVDIIVEQDKLIFHPQAAAPPIFWVKTNPSFFICRINFVADTQKTQQGIFYSTIFTLDFFTHVNYKFNFLFA